MSTSASTGALTVTGGVGIGGNIYVGGDKITINTPALNNGGIQLESDGSFVGRVGIGSFIANNGTSNDIGIYSQSNILFSTGAGAAERVRIDHSDSNVQVKFATESTSTTTGALTVAGGVGIAGNLNVGGTVSGVTATHVGLGNVTNESKATMFTDPTFTGTPLSTTAALGTNTTQIATTAFVQTAVSNLVDTAPASLDTLNELAAALGDDPNFATTIATSIGEKAPINDPTFTGTVSGITATMVGLGNVLNVAQEPAITAGTTSQYFRGDKTFQTLNSTAVGLGNVTNESKATMFTDPTFTGDTTTSKIVVNNAYMTFTPGYGIFETSQQGGNLLFYSDSIRYTVNGDEKFILSNDGTLTIQQTAEKLNTKTSATGTVVHDFSTGATWYHSSISDDFTANFTNVPTTDNRSIICTLILNQGATAYVPNAVQIDGVAQTINWIGSAGVPVGDANDVNIATFVLIRQSNTWQVLGSIVNNPAGDLAVTSTTESTSTTTGALTVAGGVGVGGDMYVGGSVRIEAGTDVASFIAKGGGTATTLNNQYGAIQFADSAFTNKGFIQSRSIDATNTRLDFLVLGTGNFRTPLSLSGTTASIALTTVASSTTTGALTVGGGVGIAGDLFVGGTIDGYAPLNSPSFTGATLTAGSVLFTNQDPGNTGTDTVTAPYIEASLGIYASFFTNIFGDIAIGPSGDNTGVINFQRQAVFQQTSEVLNTKTSATGPVEHDFETGAIWYHSSISANFTANFTRVPTTENRTISIALILVQGATAYIPNAVQIGGAAQTILWLGGTAPTGNANKTDIVSFTLLRTGSNWTVLGSLSSYG